MATIKQFKQEITNLVKAQKAAKNINDGRMFKKLKLVRE